MRKALYLARTPARASSILEYRNEKLQSVARTGSARWPLSSSASAISPRAIRRANAGAGRRLGRFSARRTSRRPSSSWPKPGRPGLRATLQYGQLNEIPDLAVLLQSQAAAGRDHHHAGRPGQRPVLRRPVVQHHEADRPAVRRQRRVRHRRLRPPREPGRLPELGLQDQRRLELVALLVAGVRCGVHRVPVRGRRRRPEGGVREDRADHATTRCRSAIPYFYNYLSGNSKKFTGVYTCALGQMFLSAASSRLVTRPGSVRSTGAPVSRSSRQDGDVARWPASSRAGCCCRSSRCGCSPRSCSSSPTSCRRDVGRTILGPFAPQESVDALNERLGTNRPIIVRTSDPMQRHRHPRLR